MLTLFFTLIGLFIIFLSNFSCHRFRWLLGWRRWNCFRFYTSYIHVSWELSSWVHPLGSCQFLFFSGRTVVPSMHRSMNDSCKLLCYAVYWAICTDVVFVAPLRHGYWMSPLIWSISSMGYKKMKFWRLLVAVFHTITINRQWRFSTNHAIFVWETLFIVFLLHILYRQCTNVWNKMQFYFQTMSRQLWLGVPALPGLTPALYWEEIALYSQDES